MVNEYAKLYILPTIFCPRHSELNEVERKSLLI